MSFLAVPRLFSSSPSSSSSSDSTCSASTSPSSAFSDLGPSMEQATPASPPASSKTHAFFASSFTATPPPPRAPLSPRKRDSISSSSTASASTVHQPSSTPGSSTRSIFSPTSPGFHISRIFPSRYTSNGRDSTEANEHQSTFSTHRLRRKPEFISLEHHPDDDLLMDSIDSTSAYGYNSFTSRGPGYHSRDDSLGFGDGLVSLPTPAYNYDRDRTSAEGDAPLSSASSSTSSSSSHVSIRLPTPPPPPLLTPSKYSPSSRTSDDDINEFTPRPPSYEPSLSSLLRPFVPTPISKAPSMVSTVSTTATEDSHDHGGEAQEAGELQEGDIISPSSGTCPTSPSSTKSTHSTASEPTLRLVRPLGQGAFSAVWLAEDLSLVPLALTSKKSVRDLKRQASVQSKGGLSRNGSVKSNVSRNGSVKKSGWASGTSSLSKLKARLKGMKPVGVGKEVLDEHDVAGLVVGGSSYVDDHGFLRPSISAESSKTHRKQGSAGSLELSWGPGTGDSLSRSSSAKYKTRTGSTSSGSTSSSRLVAVKLTPRLSIPYSPQASERTRIGFVREVEVLRHISHPNITPLLSFLSTPTHHVLVLPYLRGGDLLSLVNDDEAWNNLSEGILRRIWCEICRAVGWMHSVGLVHRDVKLENVLVTWEGVRGMKDAAEREAAEMSMCPSSPNSINSISHRSRPVAVEDLPTPLIKLTDFGLSRFIDIGNGERGQGEMLSTRCGSEAYAAPELVMGSSSYSYSTPAATAAPVTTDSSASGSTEQSKQAASQQQNVVSQRKWVYDARETDAWACGVVLYALVGRRLPFGEGVGVDGVMGGGRTSRIGGERAVHVGGGSSRKAAAERRRWLMRIARGEWEWPEGQSEGGAESGERQGGELVGPNLVRSEGARRIASKLLVRDHRRRARIVDLWEDEWMKGDAVGLAMYESLYSAKDGEADESDETADIRLDEGIIKAGSGDDGEGDGLDEVEWEPLTGDDDEECYGLEYDDAEEGEEGWLLDEDGIASIARQEVV